MSNRLLRLGIGFAALACATHVHAESADSSIRESEVKRTAYVEGGVFDALLWVYPSQGPQFAAGLRLSKSISLGVIGSWSSVSERRVMAGVGSGTGGGIGFDEKLWFSLWRTSGELRWHFLDKRVVDAWLGSEVGVAGLLVHDTYTEQAATIQSTSVTERHLAPVVGLGAGMRFFPLELLSLGIEGRAQMIALDSSRFLNAPQGLTNAFSAALDVGVHFPVGRR